MCARGRIKPTSTDEEAVKIISGAGRRIQDTRVQHGNRQQYRPSKEASQEVDFITATTGFQRHLKL